MELELEREVRGYRVRSVQGGGIWAARGGKVYRSADSGDWKEVADPAERTTDRMFGGSGLYRRLFRRGVHDVFMLDSGHPLVVANGKFFKLSFDDGLREVHELRRGKRPLRQGIASGQSGVYYGEYWTNSEREEVRVWGSFDDGETWETIHTFREGSIRHVHVLVYDPYEDLIWIGTGDRNKECQIAYSEDKCSSFHAIGSGGQNWRTAGLAFTEDAVFWGTDNPKGDNYIFRWDRGTEKLNKIGPVIGPIYYCKRVGDYFVFSSAVERGGGDQDGYARIYGVSPDGGLEELYRLKKDFFHPVLFGYGWFEFPHGHFEEERFWASTKGLAGGRRSFLFRLKERHGND